MRNFIKNLREVVAKLTRHESIYQKFLRSLIKDFEGG